MNMKYKKTFILFVISLLIITMVPSNTFAASGSKASLINYVTSIKIEGGGKLYWDYGKNLRFFLENGCQSYSSNCKIKSSTNYKFSKAINRNVIAVPNTGYYFDGFYNNKGKKVSFVQKNVDILRISLNGIYRYDYYDSYTNSKFKNFSQSAYEKRVKNYIKTLYGTSRYKVMKQIQIYELPKKNANYTAKFKTKTLPKLNYCTTISKVYDGSGFYAIPSKPSKYTYSFKSSNTSVLTVNKSSGYVTMKGPGYAKLICSLAETSTTRPVTYEIRVTLKPATVKSLSAKKTKNKTLSVSWKGNTKNSGYEIQVSNTLSFSTILAKKTITSGKKTNTELKLKTGLFNNYIRIRAYKISNGKKIYSGYSIAKIYS